MGTPKTMGGRRWLLPGLVIVILAVGSVAVDLFPDTASFVGFFGLGLATPVVVAVFWRRSASLPPKERAAWRSIPTGLALVWCGVVVLGVLTQMGLELPAFGPVDVFFLAGYVAIIVGLFRLARLGGSDQDWGMTILDALVGGVALAALVWSALFADLMASLTGAPWWQAVIASIYPITDIIIIVGLLILVIRRSHFHFDPRLVFIALGAGAQVLADFVFLNRSVGETFTAAEPVWGMNLLAIGFMMLAAATVDRKPAKREFPEGPTPMWALIWPYALAIGLLGVHFKTYRDLAPGSEEIVLLDAVILIGVIIFARQVYAIYKDRNKVDRKRAELVASVSHELRTPLTAMVGFLTLLDEHPDEFPMESRQEMIGEATDQARHMSRLVSDLLMIARGNTSLMTIKPSEVRVMSIILAVLRSTDSGSTTIEEDLEAEVVVTVDPDRMQQAVGNLVANAVRYGRDRCLIVSRVRDRDLVLEVHDNGDGVPTRYESAIWQQFERGAHRLDSVKPGLGIGLSIVEAVMVSHGGRAEYRQSERLGGACFTLTVPDCVVEDSMSPLPTAT